MYNIELHWIFKPLKIGYKLPEKESVTNRNGYKNINNSYYRGSCLSYFTVAKLMILCLVVSWWTHTKCRKKLLALTKGGAKHSRTQFASWKLNQINLVV